MTLNLSSILNLKYELEYKFKKKAYEERTRAEERGNFLTALAFTELASFFDKMHKFSLESELSALESDRTFAKGFIGKQFSMAAIQFSQMLCNMKAIQEVRINEYLSKKDEIEKKIEELKSKIGERESTLHNLETKISAIENTVKTGDQNSIAQLDQEVKSIHEELQKSHSETVDDVMKQKEVAQDIKAVAAEVVKEETNKVAVAVQESTASTKKPVDTETQQLVFEFAKESKKAMEETNTTANIDENKINEIKEVKTEDEKKAEGKAPEQLELFPAEGEEKKPDNAEAVQAPEATTQPPAAGVTAPAEEPKNDAELVTENAQAKKDSAETEKKVDQIAQSAGLDTNVINEEAKKEKEAEKTQATQTTTETAPAVTTPVTPPDATTPAVTTPAVPQTKEEESKQKINESVEKVKKVNETTTVITENVDKKLADLTKDLEENHDKLVETKENINKPEETQQTVVDRPTPVEAVPVRPETPVTNPEAPVRAEDPSVVRDVRPDTDKKVEERGQPLNTTEEKKAFVEENTKNLKEIAEKQKEVLQVQKESVAALEESAKKLIDEVVLVNNSSTGATDNTQSSGTVVDALKEMLEEAYDNLKELLESFAEALSEKKDLKRISSDDILDNSLEYANSDKLKMSELTDLKKQTAASENELKKVQTEVFYISNEMRSVDDVLDKFKNIASDSTKIVVNKDMTDIYSKLSDTFGKDRVVLDRRGGDRRNQEDRRNLPESNTNNTVFGATTEEVKELEQVKTNDKDLERRDSSDRRGSDRRQTQANFIFNMDELDKVLKMRNDELA